MITYPSDDGNRVRVLCQWTHNVITSTIGRKVRKTFPKGCKIKSWKVFWTFRKSSHLKIPGKFCTNHTCSTTRISKPFCVCMCAFNIIISFPNLQVLTNILFHLVAYMKIESQLSICTCNVLMILYVRDTNVELFKGKWDNEKEYIPYWYNCIDRNWKKSYIRFVLLIKSMTVTPSGNIKYFIKLFILDVREILSLEDILYRHVNTTTICFNVICICSTFCLINLK